MTGNEAVRAVSGRRVAARAVRAVAVRKPTLDGLTLWTRRFAAMLSAGVSLRRCLQALEDDPASGVMRGITRKLWQAVERGETLSHAMKAMPRVFDDDYIGAVRVGEIGGILDVTMARHAEILERGPAKRRRVARNEVSRAELAQWCWRLGHLLSAGCAVAHAMETAAQSSRSPLREMTLELRDELSGDAALLCKWMQRYPALFPSALTALIGVGEHDGAVDAALKRAAVLMDYEAGLEARGKLPPLSVKRPAAAVRPAAAGEKAKGKART